MTFLFAPVKSLFSGLVQPPKPVTPTVNFTMDENAKQKIFNKPAVPQTSAPVAGPALPTAPAAPSGNGSYTVVKGDTLSAIAARNKTSLNDILNLNPQFRANPNLIKPGQIVTLKGAPVITPVAPAFNTPKATPPAGTVTTPSGVNVNPATGGVVAPATPELPPAPVAPPTPPVPPPSPLESPLFTSPRYEAAVKAYEQAIPLTPEEIQNTEEINNLDASIRTGIVGEANRPIPLPFITGRQKAIEQRGLALEQPLQAKAALLQAKRTAAIEASKFKLDQEAGKLGALREYSKPVSVAPGTNLVNPLTGKTVASGGSLNDVQARDTFYNLAQTYPDAKIKWDDNLSIQQNLEAAQKAVEESPSFIAKQTVYAINPLTGEPTIINKRGGGAFGNTAPSDVADESTLAPELKGALTNINGVKYFDASKITSAQLPYLQRAAQDMGLPILTKEDSTKIQESMAAFSSANALVEQIKNLTSSVLTAPDSAGAQTVQAARLKAIEMAPSLSTDNAAKQFIAARNSVLSLLTRASGEKGTLTDQDIARIAQALPSYGDSATLAKQKAENFSNVLQAVLNGSIEAYVGTSNNSGNSGGKKTGGGDALDAALDQIGFKNGGGGTPKATAKKVAQAIGQFESGGNYSAIGKTTASGDRAYGKYQVMGNNIPSWTKEVFGKAMTIQEFLKNPQAQDQLAEAKMGKLLAQYGNIDDVASVWFSGRPVKKAGNAKDVNGTTVPGYIKNIRSIYNKLA